MSGHFKGEVNCGSGGGQTGIADLILKDSMNSLFSSYKTYFNLECWL